MIIKDGDVVSEEEGSDLDFMTELESCTDEEGEDASKGDLLVTRRV